ncbi:hypothetical protein RclHR1_02530007 [Rhizophagus clarus]|uniref:Uncharacterized protein n=1 Tax=Rhizophagus clarus TaxID=94130 RepID=A0A2Z6R3L9_9GLOM|nr:hypothetical protein RclHR1_02530007 [Rhizophagus clarus]GES75648.1 hypothetical protein GLOIN_2v1786670 [Rhizophagus clarus]
MTQNLPSLCLFKILEFHSNDLLMLYRCALVNRDWCQLTIPFLWKRPFSLLHLYTQDISSKRLIDVYISGFSNKERKSINLPEKEDEIPTKSLFNYVTFLRELDVAQASNCVSSWSLITFKEGFTSKISPIIIIFLKHFVKNSPKISQLTFNINLDNHIFGSIYDGCNMNNNWKLLTYNNANNCFKKLKVLECMGDFNPKLLFICSMVSKQIEKILVSIYIDKNIIQYPKEMGKLQNLCTLIQVQKNLNILIIKNVRNGGLGEHGVLDILELTNEIHQSLKILYFKFVDFDNYNFLKSIKNLRNLGTLKFEYCNLSNHPLNFGDEIGEGNYLRGLFNLKLFKSKIQIPLLTFMISQTNDRLTILDVRIEDINYHGLINLLETISQNCKNLLEFSTYIIPDYNLLPLLLPILSSNTKLEKLIIDAEIILSEDVNNFLPRLGKHLPSSLRVLNVLTRWLFDYDSLDKFFQESCAKLEVLKLKLTNLIKDGHIEVILKHSKNHLKLLDIEGIASISYDTWDKLQQEEHLHVEFHPDIEPTMLSRNR